MRLLRGLCGPKLEAESTTTTSLSTGPTRWYGKVGLMLKLELKADVF